MSTVRSNELFRFWKESIYWLQVVRHPVVIFAITNGDSLSVLGTFDNWPTERPANDKVLTLRS